MAGENGKVTPPYLPYKTFINSLDQLSQVIPPRIDRSIWKTQPGSIQSQILNAYKFFNLVNDANQPTETLRALVANRLTPGEHVAQLLKSNYTEVLRHDLTTSTFPILNDEFEKAFKVDGETKRKSIRFFLQAAKAAGMELSRFLLDQTRASGPRKRRARTQPEASEDDSMPFDLEQPANLNTKTILLKSGGELSLTYSVDLFALSTEDRNFVFVLIDQLRGYESKMEALQTSAQKGGGDK